MTPPSRLLTGLLLTFIAGYIDALAFIELGGYFASFMSGNTTQLGLGLGAADERTAQLLRGEHNLLMPLALIGMFFGGAFIAAYLSVRSKSWYSRRVVLLVIALLIMALISGLVTKSSSVAVILLAAVMGAQNAIFKAHGSVRLGASFVTGTIFNAAYDLAHGLHGTVPRHRWLQHVSVWVSLVLGAALGVTFNHYLALYSLILPIMALIIMLGAFWLRKI